MRSGRPARARIQTGRHLRPDGVGTRAVCGRPARRLARGGAAHGAACSAIGASLLLVVACVNVASLLIAARAAARNRETAVRIVLGADTRRLFRHMLSKACCSAGWVDSPASSSAAAVSRCSSRSGPRRSAGSTPRCSIRALTAFAIGLALTWGLLLVARPPGARRVPPTSSRAFSRPAGRRLRLLYRCRAALVVFQLALSVVLLVSAALLVRGFARLVNSDPASRRRTWSRFGCRTRSRGARFVRRRHAIPPGAPLAARGAARRDAVGAISHLPYDEGLPNWATPYLHEGDADRASGDRGHARRAAGLLRSRRSALARGAVFHRRGVPAAPTVAIVDERLAQRMWPGESAIGQRFVGDPRTTGGPAVTVTVVGVVRHLKHRRPTQEVREQIYYPVRRRRATRWRSWSAPRSRPACCAASPGNDDGARPAARVVRRSAVHGVRRGRALGAAVRDGARGRVRGRGAAVDGSRRLRRDGVWRGRAAARARRSSGARRHAAPDRRVS